MNTGCYQVKVTEATKGSSTKFSSLVTNYSLLSLSPAPKTPRHLQASHYTEHEVDQISHTSDEWKACWLICDDPSIRLLQISQRALQFVTAKRWSTSIVTHFSAFHQLWGVLQQWLSTLFESSGKQVVEKVVFFPDGTSEYNPVLAFSFCLAANQTRVITSFWFGLPEKESNLLGLLSKCCTFTLNHDWHLCFVQRVSDKFHSHTLKTSV